jgi:hypothetical protein
MLAEVGSRLKPEWSHSCRNTTGDRQANTDALLHALSDGDDDDDDDGNGDDGEFEDGLHNDDVEDDDDDDDDE